MWGPTYQIQYRVNHKEWDCKLIKNADHKVKLSLLPLTLSFYWHGKKQVTVAENSIYKEILLQSSLTSRSLWVTLYEDRFFSFLIMNFKIHFSVKFSEIRIIFGTAPLFCKSSFPQSSFWESADNNPIISNPTRLYHQTKKKKIKRKIESKKILL